MNCLLALALAATAGAASITRTAVTLTAASCPDPADCTAALQAAIDSTCR